MSSCVYLFYKCKTQSEPLMVMVNIGWPKGAVARRERGYNKKSQGNG